MNNTLKRYRPASLVLTGVGITLFIVAASRDLAFLELLASVITYSSLCIFLYTEAFLFVPPARSNINIAFARLFFYTSLLVVLGVVGSLVEFLLNRYA